MKFEPTTAPGEEKVFHKAGRELCELAITARKSEGDWFLVTDCAMSERELKNALDAMMRRNASDNNSYFDARQVDEGIKVRYSPVAFRG